MSILQLRTFVEVYRQRSLSKAAEELGLTQPAVSNHIASLEGQVERQLFVRHSRGVKPTEIADDLASQLRDSIDLAEHALARIKARSAEIAGVIHVAGPVDMLSSLLAPRLKPLIALGVNVRMHPADGQDILDHLESGQSDFALCVTPPTQTSLSFSSLGHEVFRLVAAPEVVARLQGDLEVTLAKVPMVAYNLERALVDRWLEHNGLFLARANEIITAPDLRCLRELAMSGFGWTVLPEYLVGGDIAEKRLVSVAAPVGEPVVKYHLCWRTSAMRSPRIARVQQLIQQEFEPG